MVRFFIVLRLLFHLMNDTPFKFQETYVAIKANDLKLDDLVTNQLDDYKSFFLHYHNSQILLVIIKSM